MTVIRTCIDNFYFCVEEKRGNFQQTQGDTKEVWSCHRSGIQSRLMKNRFSLPALPIESLVHAVHATDFAESVRRRWWIRWNRKWRNLRSFPSYLDRTPYFSTIRRDFYIFNPREFHWVRGISVWQLTSDRISLYWIRLERAIKMWNM